MKNHGLKSNIYFSPWTIPLSVRHILSMICVVRGDAQTADYAKQEVWRVPGDWKSECVCRSPSGIVLRSAG